MSVTIGGTFSGLNVSSIIQTIIAADSIPITNLQTEDTTLTNESSDLGSLGSSLGNLSAQLQKLNSNSLFSTQVATSSAPTVGSATVDSTAQTGTVSIDVTQLASTTTLDSGRAGGAYADAKLTAPPAGTTNLATAMDESSVDGETFTINGKTIALAGTDVIDDGNPNSTSSVIGKINNSGAGVTATYNSSTGDFTLQSNAPIILGSGSDTSDFLEQAQLYNNSSSTVTSTTGLGRLDADADLSTQLRTPATSGDFSINGVSIAYNVGDSLNTLIDNINSSTAGVTAIYDSYEDQVVLSANQRGPQNITVADGTSNAGSALRLTSTDSSLNLGQSTLFTVNGSATVRQSTSNTISATQLGVTGVTFTAAGTGTTQLTMAPDVTTIAAAINAFVDQYNSTQNVIQSYTAVDTSDTTKNGSLATDSNLTFLASQLRSTTTNSISNTATIRMLSDLGIESNANDNTLTEVDTTKLQAALTNHLSDVEALFNDPTSGLTTSVQNVLSAYNDSLNGVIVNEQNELSTEVSYNQAQITQLQEQITVEQTTLENEFAALDQIQSSSQGLSSILGSSSGTDTSSSSSSSSSSGSSSFGSVGSSSST